MLYNPAVKFAVRMYYKALWSNRSSFVNLTDIAIENTNICNASCTMCAHKSMKRAKAIMPYEEYCKIIDIAIKEDITHLYLGQLGEPFADNGIVDKMDYAARCGMELYSITTNASLLDKETSERLLGYPWKSISFSVDGAKKDTYKSIRGLDYNVVENNILTFLRLRKKAKRFDLRVRMQMVVYDKNRHEVDDYFNTWKSRLVPGVDDIAFLHATNYAGLTDIEYTGNLDSKMLRIPCGRIWNFMIIVSVNGNIQLCCWDYEVDNEIGNVFKEGSLKALWNNSRMKHFRQLHINGDFDKIPLCKNCNANYLAKPYFELRPV